MYLVDPNFFPVLGKNILFKLQHYEKIHYVVEEIVSQLHLETESDSIMCKQKPHPVIISFTSPVPIDCRNEHEEM